MKPLRGLSARPEVLVDSYGKRILDPVSSTVVGIPGPWGRERVTEALPTNGAPPGPIQIAPHLVLHDANGFYIAAPDGTLLGEPGVWVHRLLDARWTGDTRRLT